MNTYPGVELMSHPDLKVDLSIISPLIRPELLTDLEQKYLKVCELDLSYAALFLTFSVQIFTEHGEELRRMDEQNRRNGETRLAKRFFTRTR